MTILELTLFTHWKFPDLISIEKNWFLLLEKNKLFPSVIMSDVSSEKAELIINFDLQDSSKLKITIKDDGKGINPKVIKEVGSKKEKLKHLKWDSITDNEAIQLIFEPGFSLPSLGGVYPGRIKSVSRL